MKKLDIVSDVIDFDLVEILEERLDMCTAPIPTPGAPVTGCGGGSEDGVDVGIRIGI
ncbi:hypothetical protein [Deinococcus sp. LM3]|uniref:hypothetical protein n=1 Tax=Deinococcus sp. LM3 TaxID=1938608 RepID=UPI00143B99C0|nr:hypothetical protein [Deinococcus sp. LM3]